MNWFEWVVEWIEWMDECFFFFYFCFHIYAILLPFSFRSSVFLFFLFPLFFVPFLIESNESSTFQFTLLYPFFVQANLPLLYSTSFFLFSSLSIWLYFFPWFFFLKLSIPTQLSFSLRYMDAMGAYNYQEDVSVTEYQNR